MKLENRIALVTGASRGIGRSIALSFAAQGANLAVVARSHEALTEVVGGITDLGRHALSVAADLGNEADIQRIVLEVLDRFGQIDLLVNNAGIIHPPVDLAHFDPTLWRRVLDVNLTGPALLTKAVLPSMMARKSGKIIIISSIGGRKGAPGRSAYRATKAALISLTESVAAEARPYGIEVTCICPGGVDTEGFREAFGSRGREEDPSLMRPEEIAEVAVFLASDASTAVTGTAIDAFGDTNPLFRIS